MFDSLAKAGKYLGQAAKLMIGMPDYDNYVEHMRVNHPDQTPMTYLFLKKVFRERQDALPVEKAARAAAEFVRQALSDSTFWCCTQRIWCQRDWQVMNGFHRTQGVGNHFVDLRLIIDIHFQLRQRSRQMKTLIRQLLQRHIISVTRRFVPEWGKRLWCVGSRFAATGQTVTYAHDCPPPHA